MASMLSTFFHKDRHRQKQFPGYSGHHEFSPVLQRHDRVVFYFLLKFFETF